MQTHCNIRRMKNKNNNNINTHRSLSHTTCENREYYLDLVSIRIESPFWRFVLFVVKASDKEAEDEQQKEKTHFYLLSINIVRQFVWQFISLLFIILFIVVAQQMNHFVISRFDFFFFHFQHAQMHINSMNRFDLRFHPWKLCFICLVCCQTLK